MSAGGDVGGGLPAYRPKLAELATAVEAGSVVTDRTTVRLVVVLLGLLAIIATAGVVLLANRSLPIPDALIAIGSATIGALGALLAKTSSAG